MRLGPPTQMNYQNLSDDAYFASIPAHKALSKRIRRATAAMDAVTAAVEADEVYSTTQTSYARECAVSAWRDAKYEVIRIAVLHARNEGLLEGILAESAPNISWAEGTRLRESAVGDSR
jgi:hypothetical protein